MSAQTSFGTSASTTREVLINDTPLSSRKTPKSSPKFFYDELVTKTDSSWNERHWSTTVTKCLVSSLNGYHSMTKSFRHWCTQVFVITCCSVRLPNGACHAGSWRVLRTWHVHVAGDVASWRGSWRVQWRGGSTWRFFGPHGTLWLVHVASCEWFTFSSQNPESSSQIKITIRWQKTKFSSLITLQ